MVSGKEWARAPGTLSGVRVVATGQRYGGKEGRVWSAGRIYPGMPKILHITGQGKVEGAGQTGGWGCSSEEGERQHNSTGAKDPWVWMVCGNRESEPDYHGSGCEQAESWVAGVSRRRRS